MHGIALQEFLPSLNVDGGKRAAILTRARLSGVYAVGNTYPGSDLHLLVVAASQETGRTTTSILEAFGRRLAGPMLVMHAGLIVPEWSTLDVVERARHLIYRLARSDDYEISMQVARPSPSEVVYTYTCAAHHCAVLRGLLEGLGLARNTSLLVEEEACRAMGAPACVIRVTG